ncbi:hypothetical protein DN752_02110 [Echinicola strongylocentroti]|uniref:Uncharacterized protein n=1 Tax=Echinicola strongylocentroti TaxID=1795355 RepID=A0A2Z4IEF5_9BACT|nr:hypothetical protein [Echinicola strongylocentroti]AWW29026.1 hypothetical protein DN752_02110 [Echinicola strongylocentroti]
MNFTFEEDDSQGDRYHYNMNGIPDTQAKKIFKTHHPENIFLCENDGEINNSVMEVAEMIKSGTIKF